MECTRLGDTGLKISRLALGCMSYGDPTTEGAHRWALADDEAQPFFQQAIELGIIFWDTANSYQAGTSEEVVGRAIRRYSRRENIVLARRRPSAVFPAGQGSAGPPLGRAVHPVQRRGNRPRKALLQPRAALILTRTSASPAAGHAPGLCSGPAPPKPIPATPGFADGSCPWSPNWTGQPADSGRSAPTVGSKIVTSRPSPGPADFSPDRCEGHDTVPRRPTLTAKSLTAAVHEVDPFWVSYRTRVSEARNIREYAADPIPG
jgi:hypothetical protein